MPTNEYGYEVDEFGDLLPGQSTPGSRASPQRVYDPVKKLWYQDVGGRRIYDSPAAYNGGQGLSTKGGGYLHQATRWNQNTGREETPYDWGKIGALATAGALTGGAASSAFGGAAAGGGTATGSGLLPSTTLAGSSTLGGGTGGLLAGGTSGLGMTGGGAAASGLSTTGSILKTAGSVGDALGNYARGRAAGRVQESDITQSQDRNAIARYNAQLAANRTENAFTLDAAAEDRARRNFALAAPGQRAGNSVRGDILANARDVSINAGPNIPIPSISGGLRPSMFSDSTRQLGGLLSSQALADQQAGDKFDPLTYVRPPDAPPLSALPSSGKADSILNAAGTIGTMADIWNNYKKIWGG